MQSKISFFNKTIFKKNITHYWPLWLGYLIISLFEIPFAIYLSGRGMEYYGYTGETLKAEQTYQCNFFSNIFHAFLLSFHSF